MSSNSLDEVLRKAIDLNIRYYSTLGRLAADYMRELTTVMAEPMKSAVASSASAFQTSAAASPAAAPAPAVMVMEAEAGSVSIGVFLVENRLSSEVDSKVVASFFKEPSGGTIQPEIAFDPQRIVLKPGEQTLVRATCPITTDMETGARYSGEFAVPGLKGSTIPVILRRREPQASE
jgi:hypothetical protein